jgi:acyl-coenzyme A thioesterase PaaI-like protein
VNAPGSRPPGALVAELGLTAQLVGEELHGSAPVVPEMLVPGTGFLRMSILAAWTDILIGFLSIHAASPRLPVTVDLAVDLHRLPSGPAQVTGVARVLKAGSSLITAEVEYAADGEPAGFGLASFTLQPGGTLTLPPVQQILAAYCAGVSILTEPYAKRAGCERRPGGIACLSISRDKLNLARTLNGGLAAVAIEEAVLSAAPSGVLSSLTMRYLRPARVGPVIATASVHGELARVEVRDGGDGDRLAILALTRLADAGG